jgi:hypothetical protein
MSPQRLGSLLCLSLLMVSCSKPIGTGLNEGGRAYRQGDYATAYAEFFPLAVAGNASAQYNLGKMYADGKGVPQDFAQAAQWFRQAADQGVEDAQYYLGNLYALGQGVPQDFAQAAQWFRQAADQGHAGAQLLLGRMYVMGEGVPENYALAVYWFRQAAEQGNALALYALGLMYENGHGVPQDAAQAYFWYNLAATRYPSGADRERAVQDRDRMAARLTPAQPADAQDRASTRQRPHVPEEPAPRTATPPPMAQPTPAQQVSPVSVPKHCPYPFIDISKLLPLLLSPGGLSVGGLAGLTPEQVAQVMQTEHAQEELRRKSVEVIISNAREIQRLRSEFCVGTVD